MYYQVLVQKKGEEQVSYMEGSKEQIIEDAVKPYLAGQEFIVDGKIVVKNELAKFKVTATDKKAVDVRQDIYTQYARRGMKINVKLENMIDDTQYAEDRTNRIIEEVKRTSMCSISVMEDFSKCSKVFVVHGHDDGFKSQVARFLEKINLDPIILHEQASGGKTIIEKIDRFSNEVGFAIVLYTACDVGYAKDRESEAKSRARQNVVFEHGYLIAKLGRKNVCPIVENGVELPNDVSGVVYVSKEDYWQEKLVKELEEAGYNIDEDHIF